MGVTLTSIPGSQSFNFLMETSEHHLVLILQEVQILLELRDPQERIRGNARHEERFGAERLHRLFTNLQQMKMSYKLGQSHDVVGCEVMNINSRGVKRLTPLST